MLVEIGDSNTKTKVESEPGNAKLLNSSELNSGKKERKALSGTQPLKWRFQVLNAGLWLEMREAAGLHFRSGNQRVKKPVVLSDPETGKKELGIELGEVNFQHFEKGDLL